MGLTLALLMFSKLYFFLYYPTHCLYLVLNTQETSYFYDSTKKAGQTWPVSNYVTLKRLLGFFCTFLFQFLSIFLYMKPLSVERACLLGIQNKIQAWCAQLCLEDSILMQFNNHQNVLPESNASILARRPIIYLRKGRGFWVHFLGKYIDYEDHKELFRRQEA